MDTLMIHNVRKEFFRLDLASYELTFDDGLFSQYYYLPLFRKIETPRVYFIAAGFIRDGNKRDVFDGGHLPFVKSRKYMHDAFIEKKFDQFMTVEELGEVASDENATIGAHSHFHDVVPTDHPLKKPLSRWKIERAPLPGRDMGKFAMNRRSKLAFPGYVFSGGRLVERSKKQWEDFVRHDTESCLEWFEKKLGLQPDLYIFPFNEYTPELVEILESYGFRRFYNGRSGDGKKIVSRIDIDGLLDH